MLKICSLGSGSKGNAVLVKNEKTAFLIDCGLNACDIDLRLNKIGHNLNDIDFILLTHEHIDHIKSALVLSDEYGIPLVAHNSTMNGIRNRNGKRARNGLVFATLSGFIEKELEIKPFKNSHDVFTVGYSIKDNDSHIVYATDLGCISHEALELSRKADTVMLESNYDIDMLYKGRYPYYLKKRIASDKGHLSNIDSLEMLEEMASWGTKNFILGHLSEENNSPELVRANVLKIFQNTNIKVEIALQHEVGEII